MGCHSSKTSTRHDNDTGWIYVKCICCKEHAIYMDDAYTTKPGENSAVKNQNKSIAEDSSEIFTCDCGETLTMQDVSECKESKWQIRPISKNDKHYIQMGIKEKEKERKQPLKAIRKQGKSSTQTKDTNTTVPEDIDTLADNFKLNCTVQDTYKQDETKHSIKSTAKVKRKPEDLENTSQFQKKAKTDTVADIKDRTTSANDTGHIDHPYKDDDLELQTENEDNHINRTDNENHDSKETIENTEKTSIEVTGDLLYMKPNELVTKDNTEQETSKDLYESHNTNGTIRNTTLTAPDEAHDQQKLQDPVDTNAKYCSHKDENKEIQSFLLDGNQLNDNSADDVKCLTEVLPDQACLVAYTADTDKSAHDINDIESHENKEEEDKERIRSLENEINKLKENEINSTELQRQIGELKDMIVKINNEKTKQLEDICQAKQEMNKSELNHQVELERINRESTKKLRTLQDKNRSLEVKLTEVSKQQKENKEELQKKSKTLQNHEMYLNKRRSLIQFKENIENLRPQPLHNLGNTCFMDAMLQNIAWCPKLGNELRKVIIDMHEINDKIPNEMQCRIFDLVRYTLSIDNTSELSSSSVPKRILEEARKRNDVFNGYRQQDSFEMFNTIVDGMREEIVTFYKDKESGLSREDIVRKYGAVRLFIGKFITVFKYSSCEHVESVFQSFTSVTVPIVQRKHNNPSSSVPTSEKQAKKSSNVKSGKRKGKNKTKKHEPASNGTQETNSLDYSFTQNNSETDTTDNPPAKKSKKSISSSDDEEFYDARDTFDNAATKSAGSQTDELIQERPCHTILSSKQDITKSPADSTEKIYSRKKVFPFDTLKQPDRHLTDIEYGLSHGLMSEETFGEDIMSCRKCASPSKSGTCYKKLFICEAPYVLVLHIDRFKEDYHGGLLKRNDLVTYPDELDLNYFCSTAAEKVHPKDTELLYKLYGVVAHSGSINSGHYVAYIKTTGRSKAAWYDKIAGKPSIDPAKKKQEIESHLEGKDTKPLPESDSEIPHWFYISDEHISECSQDEALNNKNAYVLMYERK